MKQNTPFLPNKKQSNTVAQKNKKGTIIANYKQKCSLY
ncbi:hypothetical protein BC624_11236 [Flavobacterium granuli]|uniref:Uncharacterized protein n=1 Tax=Flavobacterium granuli TaxID=280093 RepID=A0A1M5TEU6_9FLAO|nr:hypothetical protein BC624_11236 [Flavobacterium granuli]SHH49277.1 hypothetical protein SAMN05443373_11436 [Flavobacterium granuli]